MLVMVRDWWRETFAANFRSERTADTLVPWTETLLGARERTELSTPEVTTRPDSDSEKLKRLLSHNGRAAHGFTDVCQFVSNFVVITTVVTS